MSSEWDTPWITRQIAREVCRIMSHPPSDAVREDTIPFDVVVEHMWASSEPGVKEALRLSSKLGLLKSRQMTTAISYHHPGLLLDARPMTQARDRIH